jgi:hypothetical protein
MREPAHAHDVNDAERQDKPGVVELAKVGYSGMVIAWGHPEYR